MPVTRRKRANPPEEPEGNASGIEQQNGNPSASSDAEQASAPDIAGTAQESAPAAPIPAAPAMNGDRAEYSPAPESGRRTTFRRPAPPSQPQYQPQPAVPQSAAPTATHEITLPLGNLLHLAYNPAYTNSEEARSVLLHRLENESKAGGRGRCWNCGSLAINYDCWNTRSRNFGEVGIAICEVCGVWSVL